MNKWNKGFPWVLWKKKQNETKQRGEKYFFAQRGNSKMVKKQLNKVLDNKGLWGEGQPRTQEKVKRKSFD